MRAENQMSPKGTNFQELVSSDYYKPELYQPTLAASPYKAGDVVIITHERKLYFLLQNNTAKVYDIGVGRPGFTWSGVVMVERKEEWPDWYPPKEMLERQPNLPRRMAGGPGNPFGRAALYLYDDLNKKKTLYRIHGTNDPKSIRREESSGCFRMSNENIMDLYGRVQLGATVYVLP